MIVDKKSNIIRFSAYPILVSAVFGVYMGMQQKAPYVEMTTRPELPASVISLSENVEDTEGNTNRCSRLSVLYSPDDERFCGNIPKLDRFRLFEINLSGNRILFYEQGMLVRTFPIAYQAAYGKWFQTPTGYFEVGVKKPKFKSSIVPVYMENAVQLYEDFFVHGIPYYEDGTRVTSKFSGGCIRLNDAVANDFYTTAQKGDDVVSYAMLDEYATQPGMESPVISKNSWVRQRFNSPLKADWTWHSDNRENYIQHTGVDFAPLPGKIPARAYAIADGTVEKIVRNGSHDRGLGNTIIVSYVIKGTVFYGLYGHLASIREDLSESQRVQTGEELGTIGNTGYGCDYWKVGADGCDTAGDPDTHLHFELKTKPVLDAPIPDPACAISSEIHSCVGYTSDDPSLFGYVDPMQVLFDIQYEES